ncbi:MAG TPA: nitrate/sulfonate/bicarbonate ABC transporter ATP-binding protein [Steroidobacteraceae bacterium]|nr:nitrate/sulfonate/bicarbonate ABC transporter ATP-binding protein [Steroidobacteraceae bacterium]
MGSHVHSAGPKPAAVPGLPAGPPGSNPGAGNLPAISELSGVGMTFITPGGRPLPVLEHIDLRVRDGEIVGLLGRSGSGKSTLLRVAAGLARPTQGSVRYCGEPLTGPHAGIAMVFQTFALYPWLTVLENVELGLDALQLPADEERRRALAAIDLIGLDGFQSAFPRELSGGMRQRVGFARAIVSSPVLLLMDEPFSALDVLTAETLRSDFLDLWTQRQLPTRGCLLVTHNIEEAVLLCDRILVLGSHPGCIAAELPVDLPQPRNRLDAGFGDIVDEIYNVLGSRLAESLQGRAGAQAVRTGALPRGSINRMLGLVETLAAAPYRGEAELASLAHRLALPDRQLFPPAAALHLLEFAALSSGHIRLTAAGRMLAQADTQERKRLFREHLPRFVPLVAHICRVLAGRPGHAAPRARFELELQDHLTTHDAEATLRTAIGWGRYAEVFTYDDRTRTFGHRP